MEETFDWSIIHIKRQHYMQITGNVVTLLVLQKVIRENLLQEKLRKEESFPSLSVKQNRTIHVHKVKHFIPQHGRVQIRTRF